MSVWEWLYVAAFLVTATLYLVTIAFTPPGRGCDMPEPRSEYRRSLERHPSRCRNHRSYAVTWDDENEQ